MKNEFFNDGWEKELDWQFFTEKPKKYTAYICSPLHAENSEEYVQNMMSARAYMFYAMTQLNYNARAPHAYLPMLLRDLHSDERSLALRFGSDLLEYSDVLLVCGNRISNGMFGEIVKALSVHKRIIVFDELLYHKVMKIERSNCVCPHLVSLNKEHPIMASHTPLDMS